MRLAEREAFHRDRFQFADSQPKRTDRLCQQRQSTVALHFGGAHHAFIFCLRQFFVCGQINLPLDLDVFQPQVGAEERKKLIDCPKHGVDAADTEALRLQPCFKAVELDLARDALRGKFDQNAGVMEIF